MADHADVDDAGTDPAEHAVGQVQPGERRRARGQHPAQARQRAADREEHARTEPIDEQPLAGREERLDHDEDRKGDLNLRERRLRCRHQWLRKQSPDVLRTRNDDHAGESQQKLYPARVLHPISHQPLTTNL